MHEQPVPDLPRARFIGENEAVRVAESLGTFSTGREDRNFGPAGGVARFDAATALSETR